MSKICSDYSNTIIYKLTCKNISCDELYVGYTTNFIQRKYLHKQSCNNETSSNYNMNLYKIIRENGGWDNWNMEIVVYVNCQDIYDARLKEKEYSILLHATLNPIQQAPKPIVSNTVLVEQKTKKNYYCETCKIYTASSNLLEQHKQTKKHVKKQILNNKIIDTINFFSCEKCDFKCSKQSELVKHLLTKKHNPAQIGNQMETTGNHSKMDFLKIMKDVYNCECGKILQTKSGLWKHKKYCESVGQAPKKEEKEESSLAIMFVEMMKQNEEFKQMLVEQNKHNQELQKQMMEIASTTSNSVITNMNMNNNCNNSTTNKFNLQIFLNETCKDAMNIQEFIDYVTVQHSDFENFGKYGYVEALTRIFLRNLMELEVHRRPIHCSDSKREVLYVKDNDVWVIDITREKLIRTIKYIANKNVKQIPGWMDKNPDSKNTQTKLHDKYMRMLCFSMGAKTEEEDQEYYKKIIRNVAKEVCIDKSL